MERNWLLSAETVCMQCGGHCCCEAYPPISGHCYQRLVAEGIPASQFIDRGGYRSLRTGSDGHCILWKDGKCSIHGIKPETCRAGPFTFDVKGDTIEIFLKFEKLCPIVRLLREAPGAYDQQYSLAVRSITHLVSCLTEEELAVICRIDEPETEKVAEIPREYRSDDHRH